MKVRVSQIQIACHRSHSFSIDKNNKIWGWGYNNYGQLGINSTTSKLIPTAVCGNHTFCIIRGSGYLHAVGIDNNGILWTWGRSNKGQLGNNTATSKRTPVAVCGNHIFCEVFAVYYSTFAIDNNGKLWGWGYNNKGQLGNNLTTDTSTPIAIYGTKTFCKVTGGGLHTFALDNHGKLWSWGANDYGQLGNNNLTSYSTPIAVCGNYTFCQIDGGTYWGAGIDNNKKAWCWGYNLTGQLGDNSLTCRSTPVTVYGNHTFCYIDIGNNHALGLDNHNKIWAWGANSFGLLGINTATGGESTPVAVCGNHTFCQIEAGWYYSICIDNHKKLWGWGDNPWGNLGINSKVSQSTPIDVYYVREFKSFVLSI